MTDGVLSYARTVDRALTHRAAVSECFLTDALRTGERTFRVAAQPPRAHLYYSDHVTDARTAPSYDPLLVLEIFRQSCILASHEYLAAPQDSSFVFDRGTLEVTDPEALTVGERPAALTVEGEFTEVRERAGRPCGATAEVRASVDGRAAATMRLAFRWIPRRSMLQLRARARTALAGTPHRAHPLANRLVPAQVGRELSANVVLGRVTVSSAPQADPEVVAQVVVDRGHPALFDHYVDHIPGAVMFEALRQTATAAARELCGLDVPPQHLALTGCEVTFRKFGEFELPTDCRARVAEGADGRPVLDLVLEQEGDVLASARVTLAVRDRALSERDGCGSRDVVVPGAHPRFLTAA
ncbi:ScbA/BarX family gamma-butyrolactone biosynthesis protein [Streptomyces sp. NPDC085932]|uniref:ScbA/BarX family gamma-butyrolactone biosynthesis protein n=1 Tax=Streptomyces sp. NPDC085932 TaxID=3365741 RepID=UPI0037D4CF9D